MSQSSPNSHRRAELAAEHTPLEIGPWSEMPFAESFFGVALSLEHSFDDVVWGARQYSAGGLTAIPNLHKKLSLGGQNSFYVSDWRIGQVVLPLQTHPATQHPR
jgi:hypothetical protein